MRERPIIFSGEMVKAILDGRKSQTRRMRGLESVNENPDEWAVVRPMQKVEPSISGEPQEFPGADDNSWLALKDERGIADYGYVCLTCPYGVPGDKLWVREAHLLDPPQDGTWGYYDYTDGVLENVAAIPERFRNPGHVMYRASNSRDADEYRWRPSIHMPRWASRITLEITGVRAERLQDISEEDAEAEGMSRFFGGGIHNAKLEFMELWDNINKKHSWSSNPWVWVIEFRRISDE